MNVFGRIKDKLQSVQLDINNGLKSLLTSPKENKKVIRNFPIGADFNAGADLLSRFQNNWEGIHADSEINAQLAQNVGNQLNTILTTCENQYLTMGQLLFETTSLPRLVQDIDRMSRTLDDVGNMVRDLETNLICLEDLIEQVEDQENKKLHEKQLQFYKARSASDLERTRVQLAQRHAHKLEGHEYRLRQHLHERQKTFEADFVQQMEIYQKTGKSTLIASTTIPSSIPVNLSDINLEQDATALNEFLDNTEAIESGVEATSLDDEEDPSQFDGVVMQITDDWQNGEESLTTPCAITNGEAVRHENAIPSMANESSKDIEADLESCEAANAMQALTVDKDTCLSENLGSNEAEPETIPGSQNELG